MAKQRPRVSALAKELGVSNKDILEKLRAEGLGEQVPTHSSTVSAGLEATIREWFANGSGGGTAVETAAPVATEKRQKTLRARKVASDDDSDDAPSKLEQLTAGSVDLAEPPVVESIPEPVIEAPTPIEATPEPVVETPEPIEPLAPAATAQPATPPATPAPIATMPQTPTIKLSPTMGPISTPPVRPPQSSPQQPLRPAASLRPTGTATPPQGGNASAAPGTPGRVDPTTGRAPPQLRATVSINSQRPREPVSAAPQLVRPVKIEMKGPRVVREEKPDVVPAPRPRRPIGEGDNRGPGGPGRPGGFGSTSLPGGRGVRATGTGEGAPTETAAEAEKKKDARSLSGRRRGADGRRGEAEEKLKEFTEADLIERRDRLQAAASYRTGLDAHLRKSGRLPIGPAAKKTGAIEVEEPISIRTLSAATGIKSNDIIRNLMKKGTFATINQALDYPTAAMIALDFGVEIEVKQQQTAEEMLMEEFEARTAAAEGLLPRSPVVTILGHVDHGKTSLLDRIRSANVAAGESGGITQHIAAFNVELDRGGVKRNVTFIDTPGHQAFTAMRARGASITDIVVLVVDAAQGIQPQTVESINHARAAGVPIVVALNKIDLADANPDMVLGQLAAQELSPVEWGGQTEVVRTSAKTGEGIEALIEILDLQAEVMELKAMPDSPARGTVIEARRDQGLGAVATVLVQDGTLKVGDVIIAGDGFGRVRTLLDGYGKQIQSAGPSMPVLVSGINDVPGAGDKFFALDSLDRAREIGEMRSMQSRHTDLSSSPKVSLDNLFSTMREGDIKTINLIIKGDVAGSVETLEKTVTDQNTGEVRVKVIHSAVGPINESDVELATASEAVIIGFHVVPDEKARRLAEARHVEIRTYRVIYEIFDDLKKALSGMLEPEVREKHHGTVEIRAIFKVSRLGNVAGCFVTEGHITRGSKVRVIRDDKVIVEGLSVDTLKRIKEDVREVKTGFECGIKLANYDDIKVGDKLDAYIREEFKRTL